MNLDKGATEFTISTATLKGFLEATGGALSGKDVCTTFYWFYRGFSFLMGLQTQSTLGIINLLEVFSGLVSVTLFL